MWLGWAVPACCHHVQLGTEVGAQVLSCMLWGWGGWLFMVPPHEAGDSCGSCMLWGWVGWLCSLPPCGVRDSSQCSMGPGGLALHTDAICGQGLRWEHYGTGPHSDTTYGQRLGWEPHAMGSSRVGPDCCCHVWLGTWVGVVWGQVGLALLAATYGSMDLHTPGTLRIPPPHPYPPTHSCSPIAPTHPSMAPPHTVPHPLPSTILTHIPTHSHTPHSTYTPQTHASHTEVR